MPELDDFAIGKERKAPIPGNGATSGRLTDEELRALIVRGEPGRIYQPMLSLSSRLAHRGKPAPEIEHDLEALLNACEWQQRDPKTWQERFAAVKGMALSAVKKFAPPKPAPGVALRSLLVSLDDLDDSAPPPHFIASILPADEVTLISGHGGVGKSYFSLAIGLHLVIGRPLGPLDVQQSRVLFYSSEDGAGVLRYRVRRLCEVMRVDPLQLADRLFLLDMSDEDPALHRELVHYVDGEKRISFSTAMLEHLAELVRELVPDVVIIDGVSDTYDDDEVNRARVRMFLRTLRRKIARPGRAVVLIGHVNKVTAKAGAIENTEAYSGSTAWHNSVRSRLALTGDAGAPLTLQHQKANYGPKAEPIMIEFRDGVPGVAGTFGPHVAEAIIKQAEAAADARDQEALLALIGSFEQRGEHITTAAQGPYTTYRLLRGMPGFPKSTGPDRLMRLLRGLEAAGSLFRVVVKTLDRKHREVFRTATEPESAPIPSEPPASDDVEGGLEAA